MYYNLPQHVSHQRCTCPSAYRSAGLGVVDEDVHVKGKRIAHQNADLLLNILIPLIACFLYLAQTFLDARSKMVPHRLRVEVGVIAIQGFLANEGEKPHEEPRLKVSWAGEYTRQ